MSPEGTPSQGTWEDPTRSIPSPQHHPSAFPKSTLSCFTVFPLGFATMVALSLESPRGSYPSQCSSQEGKTSLENTSRV